MVVISGKLVLDDEGELCIKMRLTPQNPNIYDIPLSELLEEYMNENIRMDILPIELWKKEE
ncbi:MAG: hypothetical protein ACTSVI_07745 [Promethearchaeota archaeon]